MAYRLALSAQATSDGAGNITFTFPAPGLGLVYTGTVFVDLAPAALASRVTVGGVPWGSSTGGQALQIQAVEGDQIEIVASGAAATTAYTAWLTGSSASAEETASQGYIYPFPAPPAANPGAISGGVSPPIFDFPGPVVVSVTDLFPFTAARTFSTAYLTAVSSGTATVAIYKNGALVGAPFNLPSATTATSVPFPMTVAVGDYGQARVTAAGGGLQGLAVALG